MPGDSAGPSSLDEGPSCGIRGHRLRWRPSGPETENEGPAEPPCAGGWPQGYAGGPTEGERRRRRMMRKTGKQVEEKGERGGRSTCGEEAGEVSEQQHWKDQIYHTVTGRSDPSANITKKQHLECISDYITTAGRVSLFSTWRIFNFTEIWQPQSSTLKNAADTTNKGKDQAYYARMENSQSGLRDWLKPARVVE